MLIKVIHVNKGDTTQANHIQHTNITNMMFAEIVERLK